MFGHVSTPVRLGDLIGRDARDEVFRRPRLLPEARELKCLSRLACPERCGNTVDLLDLLRPLNRRTTIAVQPAIGEAYRAIERTGNTSKVLPTCDESGPKQPSALTELRAEVSTVSNSHIKHSSANRHQCQSARVYFDLWHNDAK